MGKVSARVLAVGSFALSVALSVAATAFMVRAWRVPILPTEFGVKGYAIAFALVMGGVGSVVALRRPSNAIGWLFCGLGVISGVMAFGTEYARWALIAQGGRSGTGAYAAWLQEWLWIPLVSGIGVVAAIFPDGRFLPRKWRLVMWLSIVMVVVPATLSALVSPLTIFQSIENPVVSHGVSLETASASISLMLPVLFLGAASAIVRFRRSRGEERQQLKWLVLAASLVAMMIAFYGAVASFSVSDPQNLNMPEYLASLSFLAVPISVAFGVLKYRLYDIDIVINKAVVYGALAAFVTVVYVAVVVGIGAALGFTNNAVLSAAAIVALAFQPARRRAQRLANRMVYGERATPYQVLSELGDRLAGEYAVDDVVHRVAATLAGGIGAEQVVVWLHVGSGLRVAGVSPSDSPAPAVPLQGDHVPGEVGGLRVVEVRHQGELLGAIGVRKPASEPMTLADEKLVADLASHAGLVLRNARLVEELRASRQRLVAAQDEERRRIERNIHDGAQQQLVALAVKIRLTDTMVGKDEDRAHAMLSELQADATGALEDLRDLAHGIYPPLLADRGLVAALEAQGRKAVVPVTVAADGVDEPRPRPRLRSTSACWKRCRTSRSTRARPWSRFDSRTTTAR
jgi:signal transduction histidine kinase